MSDSTETNPVFSPRIGCLQAAVVTLVFVITLSIASAIGKGDPRGTGELAVRLAFIVAPLAFFASYLYQRGHKLFASALVLVLCVGIPNLIFGMKDRLEVTDAEKRGLKVVPDRIYDADFGFALPNPGPAFRLIDLPAQMSAMLMNEPAGRGSFAWVLQKADSSEVVIVSLFKESTRKEREFRQFAEGLRGRLASLKNANVLEDTVAWTSTIHEYRAGVRIANGLFGKLRCLVSPFVPPTIVCVSTWARESTELDFVRAGLKFELPSSP